MKKKMCLYTSIEVYVILYRTVLFLLFLFFSLSLCTRVDDDE